MIRPSQAEAIERQLINLARTGQITRKLGDEELRSMLEQVRLMMRRLIPRFLILLWLDFSSVPVIRFGGT
jgi:hypothetical protein